MSSILESQLSHSFTAVLANITESEQDFGDVAEYHKEAEREFQNPSQAAGVLRFWVAVSGETEYVKVATQLNFAGSELILGGLAHIGLATEAAPQNPSEAAGVLKFWASTSERAAGAAAIFPNVVASQEILCGDLAEPSLTTEAAPQNPSEAAGVLRFWASTSAVGENCWAAAPASFEVSQEILGGLASLSLTTEAAPQNPSEQAGVLRSWGQRSVISPGLDVPLKSRRDLKACHSNVDPLGDPVWGADHNDDSGFAAAVPPTQELARLNQLVPCPDRPSPSWRPTTFEQPVFI